MSSIKLKHSGGNAVSLHPPTSAPSSSDVQFKLPTTDGSASEALITDGSGNLSFASVAGGKILQVQYASQDTNLPDSGSGSIVADASDEKVDVTSLSITPSATSSKIFVMARIQSNAYGSGGQPYGGVYIYRGSSSSGTEIRRASAGHYSGPQYLDIALTPWVLDSPNTTSATTYTLELARWSSGTTWHRLYQWSFLLAEVGA